MDTTGSMKTAGIFWLVVTLSASWSFWRSSFSWVVSFLYWFLALMKIFFEIYFSRVSPNLLPYCNVMITLSICFKSSKHFYKKDVIHLTTLYYVSNIKWYLIKETVWKRQRKNSCSFALGNYHFFIHRKGNQLLRPLVKGNTKNEQSALKLNLFPLSFIVWPQKVVSVITCAHMSSPNIACKRY